MQRSPGTSEADVAPLLALLDAEPAAEEHMLVNLDFLRSSKYKPRAVAKLVRRQPELVTSSTTTVAEWHQFLTGYGLSEEAAWKVLTYSGRKLLASAVDGTPNSPFNAGQAILFLKGYGWTDEDIISRVMACYPEVLAATPEQLQAVVDALRAQGFDDEDIRRVVLTFPPLLAGGPYSDDLLALIARIRISTHNKYVISGSYHV
ncbi:hypothetical protein HYH03_000242 [Edaphochlamys debaryana]|uniref:Uncharacterized protein n=1 Tax=Edaphochlamys debaryana TaxID=47281 RepID=A0A835YH59_9CHLO|nr:hypothetical protein HYH03_000242 [Edaphochlamys debaryana]|eukprot:KAG2501742.1 hypothetical protein HYH03_000242 [Edaphochlamys debaryana]